MKTFSNYLNGLVGKKGQGTLADEIEVDGALLSKFRSGQGCLNLSSIEKMFDVGNASIICKEDLKKLEDALETITDLWKAERHRNQNSK
jgi:hypothetical protein